MLSDPCPSMYEDELTNLLMSPFLRGRARERLLGEAVCPEDEYDAPSSSQRPVRSHGRAACVLYMRLKNLQPLRFMMGCCGWAAVSGVVFRL